ncbi:MAG: hypothetical protein A3E21_00855 [Sulfurimonas sp. RIFCSPHIGHO2_12_FULL_36_9]|uniref:hypothetical protein n=1 Tax=Sulfurimonas sp. RIFCSPLOWO2_12_36_12 TaxID=1802253 RepID=UPI0008D0D0A5|nr:hypothetical protein [Sulfurimonas sp. RIFCSPLOWO2_12_36_12]OHD96493.1 MAG: hypothetical protein A3E21_00855 [Sulfurimonas sp. RIFCSPHIGHO2_12_FULL_36_9]OHE00554.1 MAG: hypothetical protein A2W82_07115 [Sulfurimonas sp. RIFCSPLOWO2_12_36_12]
MYKINNIELTYILLLFMPFIAIISHRLSSLIAYVAIAFFILLLLFFKSKQNQVSKLTLIYSVLMLSSLYLSFIYQQLEYSFNNLYYIQFFGSQLLFFLGFGVFVNIKSFIIVHLENLFEIIIFLIFGFVLFDFIMINIGMMTSQLMFMVDASSYYGKPLGLFGQFSITSTYIVVFYMLHLSFKSNTNKIKSIILFFLTTLTVLLQDSGTGYIVYMFLIITIFYKSIVFRYLTIPMIFFIFIFFVQSNLISKISYDYFNYLYKYFDEIFTIVYMNNVHSIIDFLFGIDGNYIFPIDFGPLFIISKVGFLYFILYSIAIFYMIYKAPDRYIKMAIFLLVLSNIHYPTLFYPIMNVLLPILFIYVTNYKQWRN